MLAGMSVDYYIRLERGNLSGVSESVLSALSNALGLDADERAHLFDLARSVSVVRACDGPRRRTPQRVRPVVQRILDSMTDAPAFVLSGRLDVLAANRLGRALYAPLFTDAVPNHARFLFLDSRAGDFWPDWDKDANEAVGVLRAEAGRDPCDRSLSDLIGELCTRSEQFRGRWAARDVRFPRGGTRRMNHP